MGRGPKEWKKRWGSAASKGSKGRGRAGEGGGPGRPCMAWLAAAVPFPLVRSRASRPRRRPPSHPRHEKQATVVGGGASTCPMLQGGARLSRGIWPAPRGRQPLLVRFGCDAPAAELVWEGVAWVRVGQAQPLSGRCSRVRPCVVQPCRGGSGQRKG